EKVKMYLDSSEFKKAAKGGWGINRADKGQVFTENQHYTTDYLDVTKRMNNLGYKDWGLKPLDQNFNSKQFSSKFGEDQIEDAIEDFTGKLKKVTSKKFGITDYNNRIITIDKATLKSHTNTRYQKYRTRHLYLSEVENILT